MTARTCIVILRKRDDWMALSYSNIHGKDDEMESEKEETAKERRKKESDMG
jgi:hypothetical protein